VSNNDQYVYSQKSRQRCPFQYIRNVRLTYDKTLLSLSESRKDPARTFSRQRIASLCLYHAHVGGSLSRNPLLLLAQVYKFSHAKLKLNYFKILFSDLIRCHIYIKSKQEERFFKHIHTRDTF
jgi:hypothetical protein